MERFWNWNYIYIYIYRGFCSLGILKRFVDNNKIAMIFFLKIIDPYRESNRSAKNRRLGMLEIESISIYYHEAR